MSESSSGLERERAISRTFHARGVPLLVSPHLLRERSLGQLDLVRIHKGEEGWLIEVVEVKSSLTGGQALLRGQRARIIHAANFLAGVFGHPVRFLLSFQSTGDEEEN